MPEGTAKCLFLAITRRHGLVLTTVSLPSGSDITARMSRIDPVSSALPPESDIAVLSIPFYFGQVFCEKVYRIASMAVFW